jgi:hypothetical protein
MTGAEFPTSGVPLRGALERARKQGAVLQGAVAVEAYPAPEGGS